MNKPAKSVASLIILLMIASLANAQNAASTPSGTVTNGATGKPASGDQAILINITKGMTSPPTPRSTPPENSPSSPFSWFPTRPALK